MSEKDEAKSYSRRQFLKNAGIVVGSTTIGSSALLAACGGGEEVTKTLTKTVSVTTETTKFKCPYDGKEFDTFSELQQHVESEHADVGQTVTKFVCPYDGKEFDSLEELKEYLDSNYVAQGEPGIISFVLNGTPVTVKVEDYWSLAFVLRNKLGHYGTKVGCDRGTCGTCTVLADGAPVYSCLLLARDANGKSIETVEGLSSGETLSPLQQAFFDNDAFQCGYCTPGVLMASKALLAEKNGPDMDEVKEALSGHICSCATFKVVIETLQGGIS